MKAARKRHAAGRKPAARGTTTNDYSGSQSVPPAAPPRKPFLVVVHGERVTAWGAYVRREDAEAVASKLRQSCGFMVSVVEATP